MPEKLLFPACSSHGHPWTDMEKSSPLAGLPGEDARGLKTSGRLYLLTGHRICCVVGHSKYREYAFAPFALHLRHPANRYKSSALYI